MQLRRVRAWGHYQIRLFLTAWMYFTRIPLPRAAAAFVDGSQISLEKSVRLFPLFGILIGVVGGLVFLGVDAALASKSLAVLLSMLTTILLTGALHEDGLGDFFDAFGGGWWSKERILEIMKDSRMGTFGVLALVFALLIKYQFLMALDSNLIPVALVAGHAFSRFASGSFFFTHRYMQANDKSHFKPMARAKMTLPDFCVLALFGVVPFTLLGHWAYLVLIPILWAVRSLFGRWFVGKLGGYTGDCLGATQQVVELSFYMGVLVIARNLA